MPGNLLIGSKSRGREMASKGITQIGRSLRIDVKFGFPPWVLEAFLCKLQRLHVDKASNSREITYKNAILASLN